MADDLCENEWWIEEDLGLTFLLFLFTISSQDVILDFIIYQSCYLPDMFEIFIELSALDYYFGARAFADQRLKAISHRKP